MSQSGSLNSSGGGGGGIESINTDTGGPVVPVAGVINAFGAGGTVTSGSGNTLTITSSGSSSNSVITYSAEVDLKVAGVNNIFTATSDFWILAINFYGVDVTSNPGANFQNLGWTAPDYLDFAESISSSVTITNQFYITFPPFSSGGPAVPSGETFVINVTVPSTDSVMNVQRIDIVGYYT